jgi:hypothetical protein
MKLLTEKIKKTIPPLYSQEKSEDPMVLVKFFTPWTCWTWYVIEMEEQEDGEVMFYGLVDGLEEELGYFLLSELESTTGPGGLRIERDLYFEPRPLSRIQGGTNE